MEVVEDMMENLGAGGLIQATLVNCSCDDNEKVEDDAMQGHGKDHARNGKIDLPKVMREHTTEE
jgi:hypothetical protein